MLSPAPPPRPRAIVCVDDDETLLQALRDELRRGLEAEVAIEVARSGPEALALLAELAAEGADVPLLISDQNMPGMGGAELLAQAHERYPRMLKVMLSGRADAEALGQAVNRAGLYRILSKPWQRDDLVMTVREALRSVEREQALAASHRELHQSMALLNATLDATADGLLVIDREGRVQRVNRQLVALWRLPEPPVLPEGTETLLAHMRAQLKDPQALHFDADAAGAGRRLLELHDGSAFECSCRAHALGGQRVGTVASFRDVTDLLRGARMLRHQALHDRLTGLPNRSQFDDALQAAIAGARRRTGGGPHVAVLFVDLDRFKRVNDTLGHAVGDRLLQVVAQRLAPCVRDGDLIARWGGDEFTVLLPRVDAPAEAHAVAQRFLAALGPPVELGGHVLHVSASIGVAVFPEDGADAQALVKNADAALYRVKADGRNGWQPFGGHGRADGASALALEADLHDALERGLFRLHYQPQFDVRTGAPTHLEALLRWQHPRAGWIPPRRFLALAEEVGLAVPIGRWVLQAACRQAAAWRAAGHDGLHLTVNVGAAQVERGDLADAVQRALDASGLPAERLELEISEAAGLRDVGATAAVLRDLRRRGARIALDDFGTGHAPLHHLKLLPCQTLKIDRSFVTGLERGSTDAAIVAAATALGGGLGMRVVAVGVEQPQAEALLRELGCTHLQGYRLARPMEPEAIGRMLAERAPAAAMSG